MTLPGRTLRLRAALRWVANLPDQPLEPLVSIHSTQVGFSAVFLGRRVIEISAGLAGEQCGHALAGFGAEVIVLRATPANGAGEPHPLDALKQVVALDPWQAENFDEVARLCADAAVVIEDRPPMGWPGGSPLSPRLVDRHPHLFALCLSPFGLAGPYASHAAYPLNTYHAGGHAQQIPCDPLRPQDSLRGPLQAGGNWGEAQAGGLAAVAAVACLLDARHHAGAVIDCSKQEALLSFNWPDVARFANEGRSPTRLAPLATIVGGVLPCADGFVQIAVREDHQWAALARLLEHPEWAHDPQLATRAARSSRWRDVARLLAGQTRKHPREHLHLAGREAGIPIAAVLGWHELLDDADLAARGAWERVPVAGHPGLKLPRWDAHVSRPTAPAHDAPAHGASAHHGPDGGSRPGAPGKPLQGLRVIDLGWVAMGPYAGYLLAALGAQVIHVGRPPKSGSAGVDMAAYNYGFDTLNTGKTWVGIDLKRPDGVELMRQLAAHSDLVLENFRPGVTDRLGIGYAELSAVNPRLVMVSASTYGRQQMAGAYVGYAPVFAALAGLTQATGYADGPPTEVSTPVDFFAGSVAVLALLAGLHRRLATGAGCHIDLSAREAMLWSLANEIGLAQMGRRDGRRLGNGHPEMVPHGVYRCRGENRWISIATLDDAQWQRLCTCIGDDALRLDARWLTLKGRLQHRAAIDLTIENWTQAHDPAAVFDRLQAAGLAAFVSCTSQDLCQDRHLEATGAFMERETARGRRRYMAAPWRHLGLPRQRLDTVEGETAINAVFSDLLGLSRERIEELRADGTIAAR